MSTPDIRRRRLAELIRLHFDDKQAAFLAVTGGNQGELSGILSGAKSFGEKKARKFEVQAKLLAMCLDAPEGSPFYESENVNTKSRLDQIETGLTDESEASPYNISRLPDPHTPVGSSPARRVYVVGRANGGLPERIWTDGGYLVGATEEFALLATDDPCAFLTPVIGTSMVPVYNPGDFAFVEPGTEIDLGDDVLVRLKTGETMLKRLLVRRPDGIQLGSYGEPGTLYFKPEEITWMYYVAHPVRRKKIKTRF